MMEKTMTTDRPRTHLSLIPNDRPRAIDGSVSPYASTKRGVSPEELEAAENELRERAKKLYKQIETTYWELGQCLYDVYDGVPGSYRSLMRGDGSRAARRALFDKWGYQNFAEYCEKEIGIKKRSAESLRYAYYWFEIELMLPTEVREDIKALGRSKVYLLSGFVTNDDVMSWLGKAKTMTYEDLKRAIKQAKAIRADKNTDHEERDEFAAYDGGDGPTPAPAPERMHTFTTSLYDGQFETVSAALERARQLSGSDKNNHNLELICQDFLTNNDFGKVADEKKFLAKIERHLGKKLIAIDPRMGTPVYGSDLLWMLVKSKSASDIDFEDTATESEAGSEADDEGE
jgi:hypothetical protein